MELIVELINNIYCAENINPLISDALKRLQYLQYTLANPTGGPKIYY